MKKKCQKLLSGILIFAFLMTACQEKGTDSPESTTVVQESTKTNIKESTAPFETETAEETEAVKETQTKEAGDTFAKAKLDPKKTVSFSLESGFYGEDQVLTLEAGPDARIFYTLDGRDPDENSTEYVGPISLFANQFTFPQAYAFKVAALFPDQTKTGISTRTFFVSKEIDTRFDAYVFSITGDPALITDAPEGILYGENAKVRGDDTERPVVVEVFTPQGECLLSQRAGIRAYGGASREAPVKSMKLYARKSYDASAKMFPLDIFETPGKSGEVISEYKRLVLRNGGNDFQFAYLRDEFSQRLARKAGFTDTEGVVMAVTYLNGEYYGLFWLHENYCDAYFKSRYGETQGEYVVIEGSEQYKDHTDPKDEEYEPLAVSFQKTYEELIKLDLTVEENYKKVTSFIDVENYLDYFAFNIYIGNHDWPQNNQKLFVYVRKNGETDLSGVRDGRWRMLLHDMDYSYGMYDQVEVMASFDHLAAVLKKGGEQYAPLFAKLMKREDCRTYFKNKMEELMEGVFAPEQFLLALEEMDEERHRELMFYYAKLELMRKAGNIDVWSRREHLDNYLNQIRTFAKERPAYMKQFLEKDL